MGGQKKRRPPVEEEVILPTPPDGGWGWVVVIGSFFIHVIADGVAYSFGIFFIEFVDYFQSDHAVTGWIGALMVGITWASGPIASAMTNKFGCRAVVIMGSLLSAFGFVISIFAPNIYFLYFSLGICAGLGLGLIYLPAIVSVTYYFEKKRAFATGLAVCGSGIGTFIFAPFCKILVKEYGWRGSSLILAGLLLNCIICGLLFRPLEVTDEDRRKHREKKEQEKSKIYKGPAVNGKPHTYVADEGVSSKEVEIVAAEAETLLDKNLSLSVHEINHQNGLGEVEVRRHNSEHDVNKPARRFRKRTDSCRSNTPAPSTTERKDKFYTGSLKNIPIYRSNPDMFSQSMQSIPQEDDYESDSNCVSCLKQSRAMFWEVMDFSLLKDPLFLMFAISNFLTSIGFYVPYTYLPDMAEVRGVGSTQAAFLISILGIANTVGRIVFGFMSDLPCVNRLYLYNTALALCGISTALSSFCQNFAMLAAYSACFGCFLGVYVSLTSVVLVDLLGLECLTNSFGLTLAFQGIATFIGPPLAGYIYDKTGRYDEAFWVMGILIALSGIMLYFIPCLQTYLEKKRGISEHDREMGKQYVSSPTTDDEPI